MLSEIRQPHKGQTLDNSTSLRSLEESDLQSQKGAALVQQAQSCLQFCKMKRVLEKEGGDGCRATRMYLIPVTGALQDNKDGTFCVHFTTIFGN